MSTHCPTCTCERRAPVQGDGTIESHRDGSLPMGAPGYGPGSVAWEEHLQAWNAYAKRYGSEQSAERIAERSGFGYGELTEYLGHPPATWRPVGAR